MWLTQIPGCGEHSKTDCYAAGRKEKMKERYYVAYGLHMNSSIMGYRFPQAERIGKCELMDYALRFRGRKDQAIVTIEPQQGSRVPAMVWKIAESEEGTVDHYEGYPQVSQKKEIQVTVNGKQLSASVYQISPMYVLGVPTSEYFASIFEAYMAEGFDMNPLMSALNYSLNQIYPEENKTTEGMKLEGQV